MRLALKEKQKIAELLSRKYQKAGKKEKGKILNEFVELSGYNRFYASFVLNNWGKKVRVGDMVFILGRRKKKVSKRGKFYGDDLLKPLKTIWAISGMICGKLLKKFIEDNLGILINYDEIKVDEVQKEKLLSISPATIDRMLSKQKKKQELKARCGTKPGTLLKKNIPIRTYADWDEKRPGFFEIDLVSHNGGDPRGDFIQTLDATDINTCWTETEAVKNKAQVYVYKAIKNIRSRLPYDMLGLDSDNGSEFINNELYRYCVKDKITFTRSRANRKNNNCFVEQKNYSIVRKTVGYYRYEGEAELKLLNEIYRHLRLLTNYFIPTMKLEKKVRNGSSVSRKYDKPRTPYERVLESSYIEESEKEKLREIRKKLNPAKLRREMVRLQNKLYKMVMARNKKKVAA
jgi:hypothetical protein